MSGFNANLLLAGIGNSPWLSTDELQAPAKLAMAQQRNALLNRMDEQTLQNNQIEYAARASAGLLSLNDETAMAKAYPDVVAEGRKYGYLMNAPAEFPGKARLQQIAAMGTPAAEQFKLRSQQDALNAAYPGPGGATGAGTTAAPAATGGGTGSGATLTPFRATNLPQGVTPEVDQLVRTVYGEANGQPLAGQQAVAHVVLNRAKGSGESIEQVIFKPHQFEPWNTARRSQLEGLDPNSPEYQRILTQVVQPVLAGKAADPTGGATHFLNPALVTSRGDQIPGWASGNRTTIGQHDFYYAPYGRSGGTQTAATAQPQRTQVASVTPTTATDATTARPTGGSGGVVATDGTTTAPTAQQPPAATTAAPAQPTLPASLVTDNLGLTGQDHDFLTRYKASLVNNPQGAALLTAKMQELKDANEKRKTDYNALQRQASEDQLKHEDRLRAIAKERDEAARAGRKEDADKAAAQLAAENQKFTQANTLRDEHTKLTETFRNVQDAYERIQASAAAGNSLGDLALIYSYVRLLDPSVVHEEEFQRGARAGGYGEYIQTILPKLMSGDTLTPNLRRQYAEMGRTLYDVQKRSYESSNERYANLAKGFGLDPSTVVVPYDRPQEPKKPSGNLTVVVP